MYDTCRFFGYKKSPENHERLSGLLRGANQIWTGDQGVADLCLTAWLWHHILYWVTPTGIEPVLPPWKGDVLTSWPRSRIPADLRCELRIRKPAFLSASSRARTCNTAVNSRVLYHWAIKANIYESICNILNFPIYRLRSLKRASLILTEHQYLIYFIPSKLNKRIAHLTIERCVSSRPAVHVFRLPPELEDKQPTY